MATTHTKLLHATVALQTAAVFVQSITAGLMMTVPYGHVLHSAGSYTLWVVTVALVFFAVLAWRPGGGSPQPVWYALGFLALITGQVYAGVFHLTAVHVPLAAALLVASVLYLLRIRSTLHRSNHRHQRPAVAAEYR
jgi:heme A synthase